METYPLILLFKDDARRNIQTADLPDALRTVLEIIEKNDLTIYSMRTNPVHLKSPRLIVMFTEPSVNYVNEAGV